MTRTSRKKIRGFGRKLKQINVWKDNIISYPFDKMNRGCHTFRVHLSPFVWYGELNPSVKFHKYFYTAFLDILRKLNEKEELSRRNLTIQLWLFYPRTIRSLVVVIEKEEVDKLNSKINAKTFSSRPPQIIEQTFNNFSFKKGEDNVFKSINPGGNGPDWLTINKGSIWIIE